MKKSLLIVAGIVGLSLIFASCSSISGIEKNKQDDGFIQSEDLVYNTVRYDHPSLIPNFDVGKYNVYNNKQCVNLQAYIYEGDFYLEADYGTKSRKALNIDTIIFFTKKSKISFTNEQPDLPNTFYKYNDESGLAFENLKVKLTPEEMNLLGRYLLADEVYISYAGERGRTDVYKISKKIKKSMLMVINKWNKLNNQPTIEAPKPEPKKQPVENEEAETSPEDTADENNEQETIEQETTETDSGDEETVTALETIEE